MLYTCQGGAISITCRTSADVLRWIITLLHNDSQPHNQRTFVRQLSYLGTLQMEQPIITALTILNVSRSLNDTSPLPLISTISTGNTTVDLNGTVITCSGETTGLLPVTDTIEIILIGNNSGSLNNSMLVMVHYDNIYFQNT